MASHDSRAKDHFYSRKEKSLSILCTNFLRLYNRDGVDSICLDAAALQLGVERRRIYDIVNILESIGVLKKKAKNQYTWKGFGVVPETLRVLKEQGLKEEFDTYLADIPFPVVSNQDESRVHSDSKTESQDNCSDSDKENRREKSLGLLTQNFVKLFLCSNVDFISLERAALALLGHTHDPTTRRSNAKVRRLYDIANVFSSMELIEKIRDPEGKAAFRWIGMEKSCRNESSMALDVKNTKRRVFGIEITNALAKRCNTNSSTDFKLNAKINMGTCSKDKSISSKDELSTPPHQKHGSKYFVFGPFSPRVTNSTTHENKNRGQISDWENIFCAYQPQYQNQATSNLFHHYVEAWKSWQDEFGNTKQADPGQ